MRRQKARQKQEQEAKAFQKKSSSYKRIRLQFVLIFFCSIYFFVSIRRFMYFNFVLHGSFS